MLAVALVVAALTAGIAALLVNINERKSEARNAYVRLVEVSEDTTDPAVGRQLAARSTIRYQRTAITTRTRFGGHGGSDALPAEKIERDPWLKRMFLGYAFAIDYRDRRGHAYMLQDQEQTQRVTKPQPGACLHCHASVMPPYRRLGDGDAMAGTSTRTHKTVVPRRRTRRLSETWRRASRCRASTATIPGPMAAARHAAGLHHRHPGPGQPTRPCRISRASSAGATATARSPTIPTSMPRARRCARSSAASATSSTTAARKMTLFFPWGKGLKVEQIEDVSGTRPRFPDGEQFYDFKHAETGAKVLKAQHPEFEMWSQGIHARSGVACADCHMPYSATAP